MKRMGPPRPMRSLAQNMPMRPPMDTASASSAADSVKPWEKKKGGRGRSRGTKMADNAGFSGYTE